MTKSIKGYLLTGLMVLVPFAAVVAIVWKAFEFFDGWIEYFGIEFPGAGIAILLVVVFTTGLLAQNYIGKKIHQIAEWFMLKVPGVSIIYTTAKEVVKTLLNRDSSAFQEVVAVHFAGNWTIGFVTGSCPPDIEDAVMKGSDSVDYGDWYPFWGPP